MSHSQISKRNNVQVQNVMSSALSKTGSLIAKHPSIVGGATAFIIIFSFVSANALYYQQGSHPAPILNMRGPQHIVSGSTQPESNVRVVKTTQSQDAGRTFRVQHSDNIQTASVKLPVPASPQPRISEQAVTPKSVAEAPEIALLKQIQTELAKSELYLGDIDGLIGPKTRAAIESYQKDKDLLVDGTPSAKLLAHMQQKPQQSDGLASVTSNSPQSELLVRQIQLGLSQSAYPYIKVDGVIGEQTADAIRQFEKHYRLPVTGTPNQQVLDKLKAIGAF